MRKVIIVDDESVIRKGILCLINWQELDCEVIYEAENGMDAKRFLEENSVDIVITDIKMPIIDGIALTNYIYEIHPDIKVIILTAFADFSYAQSAIKYNVVDFVIKTSYIEKIPEAILKAQEQISLQKERENKIKSLEEVVNENMIEIREKYIKDVINGIIINPETINNKFNFNLQNYFVITYQIDSTEQEGKDYSVEEHNKFISSVKNFLSLAFKDYHHFTVIMSRNILITIVSFKNGNTSACTQLLLMTCSDILSMVDGFMKFKVGIGISSMHKSPKELVEAYNEAHEALSGNFYNDNNVSVYMPYPGMQSGLKPIPIHQYTDEITNNMQQDNYQNAKTLLFKLFEEYKIKMEPIEQVKVSSMLICSACFRLLTNYKLSPDDFEKNEARIYRQIQESKSIKSLSGILCDLIKSITVLISANEKQYSYLVKEVNKYIHSNFDKAISLQSIADHVHVNGSYLSSLYKKETGESIIDILNKYRIENAKKLLKDPSNKIFEVGISVGIGDPAYFTHVFTKYAGVSPKEFREKFNLGS